MDKEGEKMTKKDLYDRLKRVNERADSLEEKISELEKDIGYKPSLWINNRPCCWERPETSVSMRLIKLYDYLGLELKEIKAGVKVKKKKK
jgi:hypothetical protein